MECEHKNRTHLLLLLW